MMPCYGQLNTGLTPLECQRIVEVGKAFLQPANTGYEDKDKRQGSVGWFLKGNHPEIDPLIQKAVDAFDYGVAQFFRPWSLAGLEPIQFTHYEVGDFYGWHCDAHTIADRQPRHFSASVELSEPNLYTGGGLEFHNTVANPIPKCRQGCITIFPSLLLHRARIVESGSRTSLVLWGHV